MPVKSHQLLHMYFSFFLFSSAVCLLQLRLSPSDFYLQTFSGLKVGLSYFDRCQRSCFCLFHFNVTTRSHSQLCRFFSCLATGGRSACIYYWRKTRGEADDSILTEAYGNSQGFLQWHGPAVMSFWQLVQTDRDFNSTSTSISLFPWAYTVVLNMDS